VRWTSVSIGPREMRLVWSSEREKALLIWPMWASRWNYTGGRWSQGDLRHFQDDRTKTRPDMALLLADTSRDGEVGRVHRESVVFVRQRKNLLGPEAARPGLGTARSCSCRPVADASDLGGYTRER